MPSFWAFTAASNSAVVLPVSLWPLSKVMCPVGIPGKDVISWKALDRGIHPCSLNLTEALEYPFFFLKLPKLNDLRTAAVAFLIVYSFFAIFMNRISRQIY